MNLKKLKSQLKKNDLKDLANIKMEDINKCQEAFLNYDKIIQENSELKKNLQISRETAKP